MKNKTRLEKPLFSLIVFQNLINLIGALGLEIINHYPNVTRNCLWFTKILSQRLNYT